VDVVKRGGLPKFCVEFLTDVSLVTRILYLNFFFSCTVFDRKLDKIIVFIVPTVVI